MMTYYVNLSINREKLTAIVELLIEEIEAGNLTEEDVDPILRSLFEEYVKVSNVLAKS